MSLALRVILPFAFTYFLTYAARNINAVAGEPISRELGLSPGDLGFLTSVYLAGFAVTQLPLGVLLDRYGPRRVEASVLLAAALGAGIFACATTFSELVVGRVLMGIGASMSLMAPFTAYRKWFTTERMPLVVGFHMVFGAAGSAVAGWPAEYIMTLSGWRTLFAVYAVLILVMAATLIFVVPSKREASHGQTFRRMTEELGAVLKSRTLWRLAPVAASSQTGFLAVAGLWAGPWLRDVAGLSAPAAASWLSVVAIGLMAGFFGFGLIASRAGGPARIWHIFMIGSLAYSALIVAIIVLPPGVATPLWIPFAMLSSSGILTFSVVVNLFEERLAGRVNTTINCLIFIFSFLVQWLFGVVVGLFPAEAWGGPRLGYQVALAGLLALHLLSYLPLALPGGRRPAA